jgi:hypothetical protein
MFLAKKEDIHVTDVIRDALLDYTRKKLDPCEALGTHKMDEFVATNFMKDSLCDILTPKELKTWQDADVVNFAKKVRARKQELELELRRRGYYLSW